MCCYALQITNLYNEAMKKLHDDHTWKDASPTFTYDLWHAKPMMEYFTITPHWIHISCTDLNLH